jgi:hypothetical protein
VSDSENLSQFLGAPFRIVNAIQDKESSGLRDLAVANPHALEIEPDVCLQ